jgi:hypothetical protein
MTGSRVSVLCLAAIVLSAPVISAQDLSRYREYQLGMTLAAVATQAGMKPSDARVLHRHPALIEELDWRSGDLSGTLAPQDSVRKILFSFHDGQLFRIAVSYNWDRTEGLTVNDMVDAISAMYGLATLEVTDIVPPASRVASSGDKIAAHWEDSQYSLNLFRPSFASTFGLILFSKRLGALARAADVKATRNVELILDGEAIQMGQQAGPARATERQRTQESEYDARQAKARRLNKALFRP